MNGAGCEFSLISEAPHPFLEEKDARQVPGRGTGDKIRNRSGFLPVHGCWTASESFPQIEKGKGCRVVLPVDLFSNDPA
jgi:hypothetical protein